MDSISSSSSLSPSQPWDPYRAFLQENRMGAATSESIRPDSSMALIAPNAASATSRRSFWSLNCKRAVGIVYYGWFSSANGVWFTRPSFIEQEALSRLLYITPLVPDRSEESDIALHTVDSTTPRRDAKYIKCAIVSETNCAVRHEYIRVPAEATSFACLSRDLAIFPSSCGLTRRPSLISVVRRTVTLKPQSRFGDKPLKL